MEGEATPVMPDLHGTAAGPPAGGGTHGGDADGGGCPLCHLEDAVVECAAMVPNHNAPMRRIMAQELAQYGVIPDKVIYENIARQYNKCVYRQMVEAGLECTRWTPEMVCRHYEKHVQLLPRRIIGKDLARLEDMAQLIDLEVMNAANTTELNADSREILDNKLVTKFTTLMKTRCALVRDFRAYQKEDMLSCGISTLFKSVEAGETSVKEATRLLEAAAAVTTAAGPADLPTGDDLFD